MPGVGGLIVYRRIQVVFDHGTRTDIAGKKGIGGEEDFSLRSSLWSCALRVSVRSERAFKCGIASGGGCGARCQYKT